MQRFQSLAVWQKAHAFTLAIYGATEQFPRAEAFGLAALMRRESMVIPLKIAEGCGQENSVDFLRCLQHARGIAVEVEYLLLLARDLRFIEPPAYDTLQDQLVEVRKMLSGFMKTLHPQAV
jgi:four helix bundle protein